MRIEIDILLSGVLMSLWNQWLNNSCFQIAFLTCRIIEQVTPVQCVQIGGFEEKNRLSLYDAKCIFLRFVTPKGVDIYAGSVECPTAKELE